MMPETMRAAVLAKSGEPLKVMELPRPVPGPGQVLVRLEACGICHTDLHIRDGQEPVAGDVLPLVLGHEGIGRVVEVGPGCREDSVGKRVGIPWIHDTCGRCRQCLSGAEAYCGAQRANGFDVDGAFAEYCLLSERFLAEVPETLDAVVAAPLLCAGATALGGIRKARLQPGRMCAVFGVGGLGQYGVQLAKATGAIVAAVDTRPEKLRVAERLGADHVLLADENPGQRLKELGGADACINFAPSPLVWDQILEATNPQAWIVSVAMVGEPVPLSLRRLTFTGENITGHAVGSRQDIADVLDLAQTHGLALEVEAVGLDDVNVVLDHLAAGEAIGRSVIDFRSG